VSKETNPDFIIEKLKAWPSVTMWCGILIICSFAHTSSMTQYINLLENFVLPIISVDIVHFMQDGAPPHFAITWEWLSNAFPRHVNGHRGNVEWPPRSLDFKLLDFFLWVYCTEKVNARNPQDENALEVIIRKEYSQGPK
jgi:hypothetical protein